MKVHHYFSPLCQSNFVLLVFFRGRYFKECTVCAVVLKSKSCCCFFFVAKTSFEFNVFKMCTHTKPNYLVKIIKAHHATLPTQPRGRMNKKGGRAAQSFSCHLTSAQKSHMHPSPIHATSFLPIFHISVIAGFSTEHLFQNKCTKSRRVRSVCKGCLREYPPSFPPSPHAYFQTNDLSLSRCEGD